MKKIKNLAIASAASLYCSMITVSADTPKVNMDELNKVKSSYLSDLVSLGLILVPIIAAVTIIFSGVAWMTKDEDEKENKPFMKTVKKILFVAVIAEFSQAILKILGIV